MVDLAPGARRRSPATSASAARCSTAGVRSGGWKGAAGLRHKRCPKPGLRERRLAAALAPPPEPAHSGSGLRPGQGADPHRRDRTDRVPRSGV